MNVREILPVRRSIPSKSPAKGRWTEHKPDLQVDFHNYCGYCGSYDGFRHTWFEVDHFIPKSLFEPLGIISTEDYNNLVYSCKFCNNCKLSKWPSKDVKVPYINDEGFIDPCDIEYEKHLYRTNDGSIMWKTPLGKWMWKIAFKFDERNYSIKLLWELNQLRLLVKAYAKELSQMDNTTEKYTEIENRAKDLSFKYVQVHDNLIAYYNSL
ncbi:HNH endonuclease [Saccharicrinis sp. FJH54]|uniref:HNH endonuclease n=1 Tax=Saccharicrinis sp. FJH54 TaxID=3344665 RepID=UPI0035D4FB6E